MNYIYPKTDEDLKNSRYIDVNKKLGTISELTDYIFSKLISNFNYCYKSKINNFKKHLNLLLIELYSRYIEDPKGYLSISKNNNDYISINKDVPERYKSMKLSRTLIEVCNNLIELNLVDYYRGVYYTDLKRLSRIRANSNLIQLFEKFKLTQINNIKKVKSEVLILKDYKKKLIDYPETKEIVSTRNQIIKYNKLLDATNITTSVPLLKNFKHNNNVYRIFNNCGNGGGRYYGGWWQQIGSNERKNIILNGEKTIEIDFKAIHPTLLYLKNNIDITKTGFDPYWSKDPKVRRIFKRLLLCMLNANSKKKAISAAIQQVKKTAIENPEKYPEDILKVPKDEYLNLMDKFANYNKSIKNYFYSGQGIKLMLEDSYITSLIIEYFTNNNIPILTIHDSFIINYKYIDLMILKMKESFNVSLKEFNYSILSIDPIVSY
ncbi:MAG: hypothetical protein H8D97_01265 [Proteobacteria bacterium]|nr:hypothetical protein [Pseudomonadota bacterium]